MNTANTPTVSQVLAYMAQKQWRRVPHSKVYEAGLLVMQSFHHTRHVDTIQVVLEEIPGSLSFNQWEVITTLAQHEGRGVDHVHADIMKWEAV